MVSKEYVPGFRLDGKVAVVTGAASGIGYAVSQLFAEKGAVVCMLDLKPDNLTEAAKCIDHPAVFCVDICEPASIDEAAGKIISGYGKIDILVNSAGIGDIDKAEDFSVESWRRVIDTNLNGTFFISQRIGRQMIKAGNGGKVVCLASQAGIVAIDRHVAYSASKAGIISMVKSLAFEWGKYGIQVNAVSPTATETPLITGYWDKGKVYEDAIKNIPAGRYCKPEEVAAAVLFLATEASNMITGENLVVDGGYTIH